ncbi:MAG TPA: anti-sigma factor antagonist [Xenococcaceae cyanobacterium]|jgi:anti-anti-sigma factor
MANQLQDSEFPLARFHNSLIIQLPERLTVLEAVVFKAKIDTLLEQPNSVEKIVLDCLQTKFIDSSGIGALINSYKAAKKQNIELVLQSVQPPVMRVLSMTGLADIFYIESTVNLTRSERHRRFTAGLPLTSSKQLVTHPSTCSVVKRGIDLVGALVGLLITGIILLPVAIAIKLDSPGKIFFQQTRCGWLGKKFQIWKFRSMYSNAEAMKQQIANQASGAFFKNDRDPRITRVGRFLRRTSIDEFPQFWNVLKGDMSLVGTRPPTPEEVACYQVPEWQRLNVKPGMTGEWQVKGRSHIRNFEDVIKLDLAYQKNWSLLYDLRLILQTIVVIFRRDSGAM